MIYDVELKEGQKSYLLPTLSNHDRISRHAKPVLYQPYLYHRAIITLTFLRMGCMGGFLSASQAARSASLSLLACCRTKTLELYKSSEVRGLYKTAAGLSNVACILSWDPAIR